DCNKKRGVQRPVAVPDQGDENGGGEPADQGYDVQRCEPCEAHLACQERKMLGHQTRYRSRHSKRQSEVENPLVLVEQRKDGREASEQDSDQERDCEVYPKRRTELAVGKGRRTDYSLRQTEILEDQDESRDR